MNSIDPGAFGGGFQAQLAVQRTALCTPAPLSKIQSTVKFYGAGRFQQTLSAQQVAALSSLLSLKPVSPDLPASQDSAQPVQDTKPGEMPAAEEPSACCKVTHSAALSESTESGKATGSKSAVAPAAVPPAKQPLTFQMNGVKDKPGKVATAVKQKRTLSLASVLDDVFEEVLNTPRSSKRKRKRRGGSVQQAQAPPADQAMSPIDLTLSDDEGGNKAEPASLPLDIAPQPVHQPPEPAISRAIPQHASDKAPEVVPSSPAIVPLSSDSVPASHEVPDGKAASSKPDRKAPAQQAAHAKERSAPSQASEALEKSSTGPDLPEPAVLPLVPGSALICACSAQEADDSFNQHQLPLPQRLREARPKTVIRQGMRVFLHNAETRRLLGPFYAKQTMAGEEKVWFFCSCQPSNSRLKTTLDS